MNAITIAFLVVNGLGLLTLSHRWAALPLLTSALYMTIGTAFELGPFNFSAIRVLVAIGALRVLIRGELKLLRMNGLDWLLVMWATWALISSLFHEDKTGTFVNRLGLVYNACGIYFLLRVFCQSFDDLLMLCRITAILLVPMSLAMLWEAHSGYNLFSVLGGVDAASEIRNDIIRAQGPFSHSILAGSIGAGSLPLMIGLWRQCHKSSIAGILACLSMIAASASSGPIMSGLLGIGALLMWPFRQHMRLFRWAAFLGYIALDLAMKAPAYYILARIDLTGGSTSWHRAALIEAALHHLSEWWFVGTDHTRHWLPYGVPWSGNHADITNYYIMMGVTGGLPLMLLFIALLAKGFAFVGRWLYQSEQENGLMLSKFMIWALGASLFSHAATFVSVSYFDQSVVFLYLTLAAICSVSTPNVVSNLSASVPANSIILPQRAGNWSKSRANHT